MDGDRQLTITNNKAKKFLIKKKLNDEGKVSKNLTPLPGLPNILIKSQITSPSQFISKVSQEIKKVKDLKKLIQTMNVNRRGSIQKSQDQQIDEQQSLLDQINLNQDGTQQFGDHNQSEVDGPQLKIDREYVSFLTQTNHVGFDNIVVKNNGSASIYYEWKRIQGQRQQIHSIQDFNEERFFCHHEQNVINPGECIRFVFSFLSKVTGVFEEEWQLSCEPPTQEVFPTLKLTGQAYTSDQLVEWRNKFEIDIRKQFTQKVVNEVIDDILDGVKTPTPPSPDLNDPKQAKLEFEELNSQQRLWYSNQAINLLEFSNKEIQQALNINNPWNLDVNLLRDKLNMIDDEHYPDLIERKLNLWVDIAKQVPIERSPIFQGIRQIVLKMVSSVPEISDNLRKELDMWDIVWMCPVNNLNEQEMKARNEELQKNKADWLKRAKKKKWNDEMEKELTEEYKKKMIERVQFNLSNEANLLSSDGEFMRVEQLMIPSLKQEQYQRLRLDQDCFSQWMRKKTLVDIDVEGRRVTLRIHLKLVRGSDNLKSEFDKILIQEKIEEEKRQEEERLEKERLAKESKKKGKGKPQQQQQQQQQQQLIKNNGVDDYNSLLKKELKHIDNDNLLEIIEMVRVLLERQAKLVILVVSYDKPYGNYRLTSSVRFFANWLRTKLEQQVYFTENVTIPNFDELMENGTWAENSVLVLENVFFEPNETKIFIDEFGNISQVPEPDIESQTQYRKAMPYSPIYIIADKVNLFSNQYQSINKIKGEQTIFGTNILREIQTFIFNLQGMQNRQGTIIIGGDTTPDKLLAIDTLIAHCSDIVLLGQIGFAFFCTMHNIDHSSISQAVRKAIKQLLVCFHEEMIQKAPEKLKRMQDILKSKFIFNRSHIQQPPKPKAKLICPIDFIVAKMPDEDYNPANPNHLQSILDSIQSYMPKDNSINLQNKEILLDYGPETITQVEKIIEQSQRLVWIDTANLGLHQIEQTITVPDYEAIKLLNRLKEEEAQRELERLERLKDKKGGKNTKKAVKEETINLDIKTTKDINVPVFNETNRQIGNIIYSLQNQKKQNHEKQPKLGGNQVYNFENDCVITIIGKELEEELNREDFQKLSDQLLQREAQNQENELEECNQKHMLYSVIKIAQRKDDQQVSDNQDEKISQNSALTQEKKQINQVKSYLSDFFINDSQFILKVISGQHIDCFQNIDEYAIQTDSEIDEEQYFEIDDS